MAKYKNSQWISSGRQIGRLKYEMADGIYITSKTYKMASVTLALYGIA